MGLTETTWGRLQVSETEVASEQREHVFIRIETTTKPLEAKPDADLA